MKYFGASSEDVLVISLVLLGFVTQVQAESDCEPQTYRSAAMFGQCVGCPDKCKDQEHRDIAACEEACEKKHSTTTALPHEITATASQPPNSETRMTDFVSGALRIPTANTAERLTYNNIPVLAIVVGVLASVTAVIVTVVVVLRWRSSRRQRSKTESQDEPVTIIVSRDESSRQPEAFSPAEIVESPESSLSSDHDVEYSSVMNLDETYL